MTGRVGEGQGGSGLRGPLISPASVLATCFPLALGPAVPSNSFRILRMFGPVSIRVTTLLYFGLGLTRRVTSEADMGTVGCRARTKWYQQ